MDFNKSNWPLAQYRLYFDYDFVSSLPLSVAHTEVSRYSQTREEGRPDRSRTLVPCI